MYSPANYELIGGSPSDDGTKSEITRLGEIEFIFRPLPQEFSQDSIQRAWMERWDRVWKSFSGWDIHDYLEILKHLPYPLMTEWIKSTEALPLLRSQTSFYEYVYPWLKSWFSLQANPPGEPVQSYRDDARRIKIRFELAEIIFNHPNPRLNLGWNSSYQGWGPVLFYSPGQIGFWSEVARCRQNLINTNLTGFPGVARQPKRQGKKAALRAAKQSESRQQVKDWHDLLINLHRVIEGTAAEMISNRSRFGFFEGREQLKALLVEIADLKSRKLRQVDRSDEFQFAWMENDGQIFYTGKGFNIPKPKE